jgi:hypothetical protein
VTSPARRAGARNRSGCRLFTQGFEGDLDVCEERQQICRLPQHGVLGSAVLRCTQGFRLHSAVMVSVRVMRVEVIRQLTEYHDCTVGLEPAATGIIVLIRGPAIPQRQAKLKS